MEWWWIVLIVIAGTALLALLLCFLIGFFLAGYMSIPLRHSREECYDWDHDKGFMDYRDQMELRPVSIALSDNYVIHATYIPNGKEDKLVIFSHGYGSTSEAGFKYFKPLWERGYSILTYDLRSHGDNIHRAVTMSFREKKDLHEIIRWARSVWGEDLPIALFGESMGSAASASAVAYGDKLEFIILDCGYASLPLLIENILVGMRLPRFLVRFADIFLRLNHRYSIYDVIPADGLKENTAPLCLTHGAEDDFVPPEHSKLFYEANKKGYKEIHIFPGCGHSQSCVFQREAFFDAINKFLDKVEAGEALPPAE